MTWEDRAAVRLSWTLLAALGSGLALLAFGRGARPGESPPPRLRIDPNTATTGPLLALPGVGPARAGALMEHRPYVDLDDLDARVPGFGPKTTAQLAPHLRFDARAPIGARPR